MVIIILTVYGLLMCSSYISVFLLFSLLDAGALAEPALEERGFPADILMEEMIPTLKLVIRAVRSGTLERSEKLSAQAFDASL